eukprot:gene13789-biopygen21596
MSGVGPPATAAPKPIRLEATNLAPKAANLAGPLSVARARRGVRNAQRPHYAAPPHTPGGDEPTASPYMSGRGPYNSPWGAHGQGGAAVIRLWGGSRAPGAQPRTYGGAVRRLLAYPGPYNSPYGAHGQCRVRRLLAYGRP